MICELACACAFRFALRVFISCQKADGARVYGSTGWFVTSFVG